MYIYMVLGVNRYAPWIDFRGCVFPRMSNFSLLECNVFVWTSRRTSAAGVQYPKQLITLVRAIWSGVVFDMEESRVCGSCLFHESEATRAWKRLSCRLVLDARSENLCYLQMECATRFDLFYWHRALEIRYEMAFSRRGRVGTIKKTRRMRQGAESDWGRQSAAWALVVRCSQISYPKEKPSPNGPLKIPPWTSGSLAARSPQQAPK